MKRSIILGLIALLSAILVFVGKDNFVLRELFGIPPEKLSGYMSIAFFIGVAFPLFVAPIDLIITKIRKENLEVMLPKMLGVMKKHFNAELKAVLNPPAGADFNIRIFFPVRGKHKIFKRVLKCEKFYKIKNVPGLADDGLTNELVFKVRPKPVQGLIGLTFQDKRIYFDYSPKDRKKIEYYNLDSYQINHTSDAEFIASGHIETPKGKIIAILSIDCSSKIVENKANEAAITD